MEKRIAFRKLLDIQKVKLLDKEQFSNHPNQVQIQFVNDRGDVISCKMEETRPVLRRSMLILFREELSSSERTVRLVETVVIQTRSSEDRKESQC